ncbi:MAG: LysR family transcriptional regulator [Spongiibacteraceae bacterium]|jgi:DNA-binding transcriptional LysR family regulator|nr:LysR family transcriptional regulator [Spongiibacteraceae bacterium]
MDTQALQAFVAVVDHASFSEAAESLHLTQPAVSKRIALLESQLDCRLFDRIGRNVTLTEAGRTLLPHARTVLRELREARRDIQDLHGSISGVLSMGISHHLGLHRLPPILQQFVAAFPEVRLDIEFLDSELAYERVLHGEADIGVITLAPEEKPSLRQRVIWRDPLTVVVAADHPLASKTQVTPAQLSQHRAILPGLETYTGRIVKALFDAQRLPLDLSMSTNYLETLRMMVSIGLGWSVLPHTLLDASLAPLELEGAHLERQLGVVTHRERSLSNAARALLDLLIAAADER